MLVQKRRALKFHAEPSRRCVESSVLDPIRAEKHFGTTDLLCAQTSDLSSVKTADLLSAQNTYLLSVQTADLFSLQNTDLLSDRTLHRRWTLH